MAVGQEPTSGPDDGPGSVRPGDPLEAAAAAGPMIWPEDPEGDRTDTPVVVMGTDVEDRSTYDPFPGQSI
jgi:hypothetical protein